MNATIVFLLCVIIAILMIGAEGIWAILILVGLALFAFFYWQSIVGIILGFTILAILFIAWSALENTVGIDKLDRIMRRFVLPLIGVVGLACLAYFGGWTGLLMPVIVLGPPIGILLLLDRLKRAWKRHRTTDLPDNLR